VFIKSPKTLEANTSNRPVILTAVSASISHVTCLTVFSIFCTCMTLESSILLVAELMLLTGSSFMMLISLAWNAIIIECAASECVEASVFLLFSLGRWCIVRVVIGWIVVLTSMVVVGISVNVIFFFKLVFDESPIFNSHSWAFWESASTSPLFLWSIFLFSFNHLTLLSFKHFIFFFWFFWFFLFQLLFNFIKERRLIWDFEVFTFKNSFAIS